MKKRDSKKKSLKQLARLDAGWYPLIRESSPGAWQRSEPVEVDTALTHSAVFACVSLIADDIGKLPVNIAQKNAGFWQPVEHPLDALLRKPNQYETRLQFFTRLMTCKLLHGNAYVLKVKSASGQLVALHILDPRRVEPLVSSDGAVFYRLRTSDIAGIAEDVIVPAREIIHDRGLCPFHPLIGVSPLTAAALAASQGLAIQNNATTFFQNASRPGGLLTAPGIIQDDTAERLKKHWEDNYSGVNAGRTAVLGDGLKYETLSISPIDAQLLEQLNFTAQDVCRAFRVPAWKIGAGPTAPYSGVESMSLSYYADCLQVLIEALELALDEGLNLPPTLRTEFDLDHLLRMDTISRYDAYGKAIGAGWLTPNEARRKESLPPVDGGDFCYLQQQNYPLADLIGRKPAEVKP